MKTPDIYSYLDFRQFIHDYYTWRKKESRHYSYRVFAKAAGFSAPSFIKHVIEGDRNLTGKSIAGFAKALKLDRKQKKYFELLVQLNQTENPEEHRRLLKKIEQNQRINSSKIINEDMFEFLSRWYYVAIWEMVGLADFQEDPAWIAKKLRPRITTQQAQEAIALLHRLDLIGTAEEGRIVKKYPDLKTEPEVRSMAVMHHHCDMGHQGIRSVSEKRAAHRELGAITVASTRERFQQVRQRMREFRQEIHEMLSDVKDPEVVYQMNFHLFHLSEVPQ